MKNNSLELGRERSQSHSIIVMASIIAARDTTSTVRVTLAVKMNCEMVIIYITHLVYWLLI